MLRRAACLAGIAAVASACSLLFSLDGYEGRDAGVGGRDGSSDAPDSGCPGHPTAILCDNFDDGRFGAKWDATSPPMNATLALSDAHSVSPPFSLLANVPLSDAGAGQGAAASLTAFVPYVPARLRISYSILFGELAGRSAAIGSVHLNGAGQPSYGVYLFARVTSLMAIVEDGTAQDGGALFNAHDFPAIASNTWTRVILDLDFGAKSVTLTLEQPPGTLLTQALTDAAITPIPDASTMTLLAGIDYTILPAGWTVYIDDVVVETE